MITRQSGRVVIITGAAGGVGQTVALRWLRAGASVLAVSHGQEGLDALRSAAATVQLDVENTAGPIDIERFGTFVADVTTEAGAGEMVAAAEKIFAKPADTLIHLVGGFAIGALDAPDAPTVWERMMTLNLLSAFHCYRAVLPSLRARGGGWIAGLGSRAAVVPTANLAAYAAAKAGLSALTQALSDEVRSEGIHVNLILASTIDTPANRRAMGDAAARNWVTPDDIADATLYLCSDQARSVYGTTLEVYATA